MKGIHVSNQKNPEKTGVVAGLAIAAVGVAMIVAPGLAGMDMMGGGYALNFVGIFVVIVGAVVGLVYRARAATLQKILAGENLLAHWHYEPGEWQRYAGAEFERERTEKRSLFWLVMAITVVIGGACLIFDPEAGKWVALVLIGMLAILAVLAFGVPHLEYRRNRRSTGEALISSDGIYLNGRLHLWSRLGSRLVGVALVEGDPAAIEFTIAYPSRTGTQEDVVWVPIPRGQDAVAREVIAHFEGK